MVPVNEFPERSRVCRELSLLKLEGSVLLSLLLPIFNIESRGKDWFRSGCEGNRFPDKRLFDRSRSASLVRRRKETGIFPEREFLDK